MSPSVTLTGVTLVALIATVAARTDQARAAPPQAPPSGQGQTAAPGQLPGVIGPGGWSLNS